jgi:periplasmic protein TonB
MAKSSPLKRHLPKIIASGAIVLITLLAFLGIRSILSDQPGHVAPKMQTIKLIKPPPPPPPPKIEEPPPEPNMQEKLDEPEPEEPAPDMADEPPPGEQLGVDAEGGAGSDSFGLIGNKGGRGLLSGAGDPEQQYGLEVQSDISDALSNDDVIARMTYSIVVKLWIRFDGHVQHFKLVKSTGDPEIDKRMEEIISKMPPFEKPPASLRMPIRYRISSRH